MIPIRRCPPEEIVNWTRAKRHEAFTSCFREHGTLYGRDYDQVEEATIRELCEELGIPMGYGRVGKTQLHGWEGKRAKEGPLYTMQPTLRYTILETPPEPENERLLAAVENLTLSLHRMQVIHQNELVDMRLLLDEATDLLDDAETLIDPALHPSWHKRLATWGADREEAAK